jgi:hypothetical protein
VIGVDNDRARARVQAEVRGAFASLSAGLRDMTARLADPAAVRAAADGDTTALAILLNGRTRSQPPPSPTRR